jgi:F-type H+-transporting ATPase subunit b
MTKRRSRFALNMAEPLTHAGTEIPQEVHAAPTYYGITPTMFVALALIMVYAILIRKKVPAAIGKALDAKIAAIRDELDEATGLRKEAEALKAEYQTKAVSAEAEAAAIIQRAHAQADAIFVAAKTDAEALVERRTRIAEDKIAAEERFAVAQLRATVTNAAIQAAAKLIADHNDAANDAKLVDSAITGLGKAD